MKKKVLALLLATAMISTFVACGKEETPAADDTTTTVEDDTTTVAVGAVVIAHDDAAEEDVYNFVSTVFENTEEITTAHAKGAELNLEFAASVTDVPYHAGAAKYFAEKGIDVATK